jgi:hypothetical protein
MSIIKETDSTNNDTNIRTNVADYFAILGVGDTLVWNHAARPFDTLEQQFTERFQREIISIQFVCDKQKGLEEEWTLVPEQMNDTARAADGMGTNDKQQQQTTTSANALRRTMGNAVRNLMVQPQPSSAAEQQQQQQQKSLFPGWYLAYQRRGSNAHSTPTPTESSATESSTRQEQSTPILPAIVRVELFFVQVQPSSKQQQQQHIQRNHVGQQFLERYQSQAQITTATTKNTQQVRTVSDYLDTTQEWCLPPTDTAWIPTRVNSADEVQLLTIIPANNNINKNSMYIPVARIHRQCSDNNDEERYTEQQTALVDLAMSFMNEHGYAVLPSENEEEDDDDDQDVVLAKTEWNTAVPSQTVLPVGAPLLLQRRNAPFGFANAAFTTQVLGRFPLRNYKGLPLPGA